MIIIFFGAVQVETMIKKNWKLSAFQKLFLITNNSILRKILGTLIIILIF